MKGGFIKRMKSIRILDCTLRDGGYINDWNFKKFNIIRTINSLYKSNIDIIECGYISDLKESTIDNTYFSSLEEVDSIILKSNSKSFHVAMINYGEYDFNKIPDKIKSNTQLDGIRVVFHKNDWKKAIKDIEILCEKGYKVFVQPMVILNYKDEEILELIKECNKLNIYAFYLVDSFGAMKNEEISKISNIINHNLKIDVCVGFHGHNNLQLAYSNAIEFTKVCKDRDIIIDSSIFGMGRGAGNLPTELISNYLNCNYDKAYSIEPILYIIDSYIYNIYKEKYWGYSPAHYLSAIYNCHPNYSTYLMNKKTLEISAIESILKNLSAEKKVNYDKKYIESLYIEYNSSIMNKDINLQKLKNEFRNKDIYLLAPGKSLVDNLFKINKEDSIIITVNHDLNDINSDYCFFSNNKRYIEFKDRILSEELVNRKRKLIITSNILSDENNKDILTVNYNDILGITDEEKDNSMIMMLHLLKDIDIKKVFVLGFDGYSNIQSYYEENMEYNLDYLNASIKNCSIKKEIVELRKSIEIEFVTQSLYESNLYLSELATTR